MKNLKGCIFAWLVRCHAGDSSDVTLAFKNAKVVPPFSKKETDDTDDTVGTGDRDDRDDKDDIDDTDDTDDNGIGWNMPGRLE